MLPPHHGGVQISKRFLLQNFDILIPGNLCLNEKGHLTFELGIGMIQALVVVLCRGGYFGLS